jgi:hypothetical protein
VKASLRRAALALGLVLGGCESEPEPVGLIVDLYTPAGGVDPFQGVSHLSFVAYAAGTEVGRSTVPVELGTAELPGIPFGVDRQLVVEGWGDAAGTLIKSRGRSPVVDVYGQEVAQAFSVMLAPTNALSPLTDAIAYQAQKLETGRFGHTVTVTAAREIVIAGGGLYSGTTRKPWWGPEGADCAQDDFDTDKPEDDACRRHRTVEVIDARTWERRTNPDKLYFDRVWHTATALSTGQVVIAGGYSTIGEVQPLRRVEVYCPGGVKCPNTSSTVVVLDKQMAVPRAGHTASLIDEASFTFLFVGGDEAGTYELYSPQSAQPGEAKPLPDGLPRSHHRATLFTLPGFTVPAVLVSGGEDGTKLHRSTFVYDSGTDAMAIQEDMGIERAHHGSDLVAARRYIYLAGGFTDLERKQPTATVDVYDFSNLKDIQVRRNILSLGTPRGLMASTSLPENRVLYAGGMDAGGNILDSLELIHEVLDPQKNQYQISVADSATLPVLWERRFGAVALGLDTGLALIVGGSSGAEVPYGAPTTLPGYNPL